MSGCPRTFIVREKGRYDVKQYKEKVFAIDLEQQSILCHVKNKTNGITSISFTDIKSIDPEESDDTLNFVIIKYDGTAFHYKASNIIEKWKIIKSVRCCRKNSRAVYTRGVFDEEKSSLFFCLMLSAKNKPFEWCFVCCTNEKDICCYSDMMMLNLRLEITYRSIIEIRKDLSAVHIKYKDSGGQKVVSFTSTELRELESFHVALDPLKKVLINQIS